MRKIIAFLLIAIMCLSLASCGCDHKWEKATCEKVSTCKLCKETKGKKKDCKAGDAVVESEATLSQSGTTVTYCTVCEKELSRETVEKQACSEGNVFNFTNQELIDYLDLTEEESSVIATAYGYKKYTLPTVDGSDVDVTLSNDTNDKVGAFSFSTKYWEDLVGPAFTTLYELFDFELQGDELEQALSCIAIGRSYETDDIVIQPTGTDGLLVSLVIGPRN